MVKLTPTQAQIIAHAHTLIMARGYNGFSYADIADAVGIRKASVHHHFPAKADLVARTVSIYREDVRAQMAQMAHAGLSAADQVKAYFASWQEALHRGDASFCICALLASELPALPAVVADEVKGHVNDLSAWLSAILELGSRQGHLVLTDSAKITAELLISSLYGAMITARVHDDDTLFVQITKAALNRLNKTD